MPRPISSSFSRTTRVWVSIVSLPKGRYLPATSWKLVRFGFPGSYIANLVRSRDRRNDRFDRSWIPADVPRPVPSRTRTLTSSFFLYAYRRTYSVPLVFIGTNGTLWRPVTHRRAECSAIFPLVLSTLASPISAPIGFYIGKTTDGNATSNHSISPSLCPREDFFDRETTRPDPNFCWFPQIQIPSGNACSARVLTFVPSFDSIFSSFRQKSHRIKTVVTIAFEILAMHIEVYLF